MDNSIRENNNTYCVGDTHGELNKLKKIIERILEVDKVPKFIFLGDYIDRGPDSCGVIDYLLDLKVKYECVFLLGNHDYSWLKFLLDPTATYPDLYDQGAKETLESYHSKGRTHLDLNHIEFFKECLPYFELNKMLFVHGGFNRHHPITDAKFNSKRVLIWDRDFISAAVANNTSKMKFEHKYDWVFLGHTPVQYYGFKGITTLTKSKVVMLDVGCGKYDVELEALCIEDFLEKH